MVCHSFLFNAGKEHALCEPCHSNGYFLCASEEMQLPKAHPCFGQPWQFVISTSARAQIIDMSPPVRELYDKYIQDDHNKLAYNARAGAARIKSEAFAAKRSKCEQESSSTHQ